MNGCVVSTPKNTAMNQVDMSNSALIKYLPITDSNVMFAM